jgi:predicted metal-dependent phosphoesterase TrpH
MAVDLHTHSRFSDGSDRPADIARAAADTGLTAFALTDHDTLEGIAEAADAAREVGVAFLPGIELSVEWRNGPMHLLAYGIAPRSGPLQDRLEALRRGRDGRNEAIVSALNHMGIAIRHEEVASESGDGATGRPHIAQVLVRMGVVGSVAEAFDLYLARGRPAYRDRPRLTAEEAVALVRASGGIAVVAHPHTVADNAPDFSETFDLLADLGVDGLECHYAEYPPELRTSLERMAHRLGLIATGGSDYHGTYKPGLALGNGRGDLAVPDAAFEAVVAALPGSS